MCVAGILSYDNDDPVESWWQNSMDSLSGYAIKLPPNGKVLEINTITE